MAPLLHPNWSSVRDLHLYGVSPRTSCTCGVAESAYSNRTHAFPVRNIWPAGEERYPQVEQSRARREWWHRNRSRCRTRTDRKCAQPAARSNSHPRRHSLGLPETAASRHRRHDQACTLTPHTTHLTTPHLTPQAAMLLQSHCINQDQSSGNATTLCATSWRVESHSSRESQLG